MEEGMKIALTVWGNRISPVFDAARTLLVAEIRDKQIAHKSYQAFSPEDSQVLTANLKSQGLSVLICGAITNTPATQITDQGIKLLSFVTGNAMDILNSFAGRQSLEQEHMMPGCDTAPTKSNGAHPPTP